MRSLWKGILVGGVLASVVWTILSRRQNRRQQGLRRLGRTVNKSTRHLRQNLVKLVDVAGHSYLARISRR